MHLRVPVRSLQSVLAGGSTSRSRASENPQTIWEHWGFSDELSFQLEEHLNDEEYIDLDDIDGKQIPYVGDIGDMVCKVLREGEISSEGMVQIDIPFVDTTDEGEKKKSAGSWMKHNI